MSIPLDYMISKPIIPTITVILMSHLNFQGLGFPLCDMGIIVPITYDFCEH